MHFYVLQARVVNGELKVQAFHNDAHHTHIAQVGSKKISVREAKCTGLLHYYFTTGNHLFQDTFNIGAAVSQILMYPLKNILFL